MNAITTNEKHNEALKLHRDIMANKQLIGLSLYEMCKSLKQMRDSKLYQELGHESFDAYCEEMAGIKSRQAYNYISAFERHGEEFLQSNAHLGITKLELLGQLPVDERNTLTESGEIEGKSVSEIKQIIADYKKQTEQIELFKEEKDELQKKLDDITATLQDALKEEVDYKEAVAEVARLEKELKELRSRPIETTVIDNPVDEKKLRQEIEKELKSKQKDAVAKEVAKEKETLEKEAAEKAKAAAAKAREEAERAHAQKLSELEAEKRAADEKAASLEKLLKMSDSNITAAKIFFNSLQDSFNQFYMTLEKMVDGQNKDKLKLAAKTLLTACIDKLQANEDREG